eukprot:CAMPEP_0170462404 /NCGR_PEP_ID=MMETSP0123-20130129/7921_1 /TAXON_ID=182087 /ORGANISM="Favella ehrenbergii, Strain Fehren 1" /LENGTH=33 /DNA_ID= /DNA_START= /DNA_END= /DNA_ORIENTATION=
MIVEPLDDTEDDDIVLAETSEIVDLEDSSIVDL